MKPEDLKNSMNSIKPDSYMETRLFAEVSSAEKPKKKNLKMFKAVVCTALCCAVLVTGIGIGIPKMGISDSNNNVVETGNNNNYFVMSVYAAENDKETATPIDDHTVTLPDYKLSKHYNDVNGPFSIGGKSNQSSLLISGENIKFVHFKCETGTLHVWDWDMRNYLRDNGLYYDIIVPYTEEYAGAKTKMDCEEIMFKHIENGDYDAYFKENKKKSIDSYYGVDFVYDDTAGIDENIVGVGLLSEEAWHKFSPSLIEDWQNFKEYTYENVLNKTEYLAQGVSWDCGGLEAIFDNHNMSFSELPHDTITVEVTFNDGSVQYASYDFSFNDNGELVVQRIAD